MKTQLILAQALSAHFEDVLSYRGRGRYWCVKKQDGGWTYISHAHVAHMIMHRLDSQGELYNWALISGIRSMLQAYLAVEIYMSLSDKLSLSPRVCPSPNIIQ